MVASARGRHPEGRLRPAAERCAAPLELSPEDRLAFVRAVADRDTGRVARAWSSVLDLAERYPDAVAVQELRCKLAMERGSDYRVIREHARGSWSCR